MQFLTMQLIKSQCRIEHDYDDHLLEFYGRTAESMVVKDLNRAVYIERVPEGDDTGTVISDDLRTAMLLIVTELYEYRGKTTDKQLHENMAYQSLISNHRLYPV